MRLALVLALVGCRFEPGVVGEIGDGGRDVDAAVVGDSTADVPELQPDASLCFGSGIGASCLQSLPTQPLVLVGAFDTGGSTCDAIVGGACLLAGTNVSVATGTMFRAIGSRPLIIVATNQMTIEGTIDVSSNAVATGAGASSATCAGPQATAQDDTGGSGGGAGGSFGALGGTGGTGDMNSSAGGDGDGQPAVAALAFTPTTVRAGCPGSLGGNGGGARGAAGSGGGAVYLIAGSSIAISGVVYAGGHGGGGSTTQSGGGGGGSGGLIGLDAPTVSGTGTLAANGGGGGGGGTGTLAVGVGGTPGQPNATAAAGGGGAGADGGDGGGGSTTSTGANGESVIGAGGGGGGGAGYIYVKGTAVVTGVTSPAPMLVP